MEQKLPTDFLTQLLNKYGDAWWFKALFIIIVVYFIIAPIFTTVINTKYLKEHISESITSTLDTRDETKSKLHRANFEASRQAYALAKHTMQEFVPLTKSEYIFLLEFHNGAENVMTGIQFCRFDMTLEVAADNAQYVPIEKFKDDIVARYDILLSDELGKNKVLYYGKDEFEKTDKYLAYQMTYVDAKAYAVVSLKDHDGKIFGAILCISNNDKDINLLAVRELALELEDIFVPNKYNRGVAEIRDNKSDIDE